MTLSKQSQRCSICDKSVDPEIYTFPSIRTLFKRFNSCILCSNWLTIIGDFYNDPNYLYDGKSIFLIGSEDTFQDNKGFGGRKFLLTLLTTKRTTTNLIHKGEVPNKFKKFFIKNLLTYKETT
ncbi:hypothetical protein LCGC14_2955920 [marine sediment metagenome]|uniref:Uncharacterized protein n=1 Tax=marine sediment metagenome TaxID=412755 RepID=A0A0F8ZLG7_9ZZZZ